MGSEDLLLLLLLPWCLWLTQRPPLWPPKIHPDYQTKQGTTIAKSGCLQLTEVEGFFICDIIREFTDNYFWTLLHLLFSSLLLIYTIPYL